MASCKIREAIGALKDQTSIGVAKVVGSSSISDLQVAIVKATRHGDNPPNPSYVAQVLSQTRYSRTLVQACVGIIATRLNRTKNWVVALKSLMLVQRLLSKGGTAFENDFFFTARRGTRFLNMSDFRDRNGWDCSAFVRAYALYLDEALEFKMQQGHADSSEEDEDEDVVAAAAAVEMENHAIFFRADSLMQLLQRFLACRPAGAAKHNRVVVVAIYPILKESFQIYHCVTEILGALIDRFMQMGVADMVRVHHIFCRVSKQYDELYCFYNWCKTVGIMRFPDYPTVEKISHTKLDMMDDFIRQKSAMLHARKPSTSTPPKLMMITPAPLRTTEPETLALPPPQPEEEEEKKRSSTEEEGDLLKLYSEQPSTEEDVGDRLALALFDGYPDTTSAVPPWEAFKESGDWETALVQSASHLSNQKPSLPQGFDALILDGMYRRRQYSSANFMATAGSASSVALRPPTLALPYGYSADPFAASLGIAPPAYVQMSELEKKQNLLLQEQLLWQQYLRDGMHGLEKMEQQNSYQYNIPAAYAGAW